MTHFASFPLGLDAPRTVPSPTPYGLSFPKIWVSNPTQTAITIISGTAKALSYELQIWPIHSPGPSEQKCITNFGEKGAWDCPNFLSTPIISGMGKVTNF